PLEDLLMPNESCPHLALAPELFRLIRSLGEEFEDALKTERPSALEGFLPQVPEGARPGLFRELLGREVRYRQQIGRSFSAEEAAERFGGLGTWAAEILADFGLSDLEALELDVLAGPVAGQTYRLTGHCSFLVGRSPRANLPLVGDDTLSRVHFRIE